MAAKPMETAQAAAKQAARRARRLAWLAAWVLAAAPAAATVDYQVMQFEAGSARLLPDTLRMLAEAVQILRRYPDLRVEVAGHAGDPGGPAHNQRLSEQRARAVYDWLLAHGVPRSQVLGPVGYGADRPLALCSAEEQRARLPPRHCAENRRVELEVQN